MTPRRPRLDPATAAIRHAVRAALHSDEAARGVVVGVSGGADSLALAAAVAFEAERGGVAASGVVVDHGLQPGSDAVAQRAATTAESLGLRPTVVRRVVVENHGEGIEAAARAARFTALLAVAAERDAGAIVLGHTLDDQAETVLLSLARGSGPAGLAGMRPHSRRGGTAVLRPLLAIRRAQTLASCRSLTVNPWQDPQNQDPAFARVRARLHALPALEEALGPRIAPALARTAALVQDDVDALAELAEAALTEVVLPDAAGVLDGTRSSVAGDVELALSRLVEHPRAVRSRIYRQVAERLAGSVLSAVHVADIDRLVTDWHGQGPIDAPRIRVVRAVGAIRFTACPTNPER